MLSKGNDGMLRLTSFDHVCFQATPNFVQLCASKGLWLHVTPNFVRLCVMHKGVNGHATPYVVLLCVQCKGDENMLCRHHLIVYAFQKDDWMPRPTL